MPEGDMILRRPRTLAIEYDDALRYMVPSNHPTGPDDPPYLVELDAYEGNGACTCRHFATRCEPYLRRGYAPRDAIDDPLGLRLKLKVNRHVEDLLRCEHLLTARSQFLDEILTKIVERRATERRREERAP